MNNRKPWWVGVRASDLSGAESAFGGAISILHGEVHGGLPLWTVEQELGRRFNHNDHHNDAAIDKALAQLMARVCLEAPDTRFLFQDQLCFSSDPALWPLAIANNPLGLLAPLKDKATSRSLFSRYLPTVGSTTMFAAEVSFARLHAMFPQSRRFVVQAPEGAGGFGSLLVDEHTTSEALVSLDTPYVVVSEYRGGMAPLNIHLVVFPDRTVVLPPSVQVIVPDAEGRLLYTGYDFLAAQQLTSAQRDRLNTAGITIGEVLRKSGYRGVAGIDFLADEEQLLFVEINPRFQASTLGLNEVLAARGLPSVHHLHLMAFAGAAAPNLPEDVRPASTVIHLNQSADQLSLSGGRHDYCSPDSRNTRFARDSLSLDVQLDSIADTVTVDNGAGLGRITLERPVVFLHPTMGGLVHHALTRVSKRPPRLLPQALAGDTLALASLKFTLFSLGARLSPEALTQLAAERADLTIRDGIAGGLELKLPHSVHLNVPLKEHFALLSPYVIDIGEDSRAFRLIDANGDSLPVEVLPIPDFVGRQTSQGTPMVNVGQMFNERLAIEIFYGCVNTASDGTACAFCELGAETEPSITQISDIRELVAYCEASPTVPMRHVLIGGGTPPESLWPLYFEALDVVRAETGVPVYMMIAPPNDLSRLDQLHARGLAEIGMNIELFDRALARRFMPAKGKLPLSRYWAALERAVFLWGCGGAVRSILIVGLEPLESTLTGVEELCRRGVMPILSPYRPIPGTPLAHCPPPSPEMMVEAWTRGQEIAQYHGLALGPTCIACQNNTIAMPFGDGYRYY